MDRPFARCKCSNWGGFCLWFQRTKQASEQRLFEWVIYDPLPSMYRSDAVWPEGDGVSGTLFLTTFCNMQPEPRRGLPQRWFDDEMQKICFPSASQGLPVVTGTSSNNRMWAVTAVNRSWVRHDTRTWSVAGYGRPNTRHLWALFRNCSQ